MTQKKLAVFLCTALAIVSFSVSMESCATLDCKMPNNYKEKIVCEQNKGHESLGKK